MEKSLKRLKEKKLKTKPLKNKSNFFVRIDKKNNKTLYHTKIMMDFYTFGIDKNDNKKFFIILRSWSRKKKYQFNLFSLIDDNKFLGIYYGCRKPIKNIITKYEENGTTKTYGFSKAYYIEFRFKMGSVFCYIQGIYYLLKKEKFQTKYCKKLIEIIMKLEKEIYEFYDKKLPDGGIVIKWIEKKQK
ncbi:DUF226 domain-containing protein [Borrelia miyamotoi]|uniref:DUF226 domain-containing protein n=1 Tax=Borrelia miyamotoi TaxID=47466 RepID=A0A109PM97_9SPIR|nr:DUF226 domain-containing protein [Borrelia miyamotoi]ALU64344.1 PF-50 type protein [Borrelia miyamotoi]AOW96275.1 hypothetical protein AXH25_06005 [Borrelia miyamotoi]QTL84363.1 DUF226 domain-containing protein [Borrelia miyamotoi]WAZ85968.1 DUF226 domain-containing protein [Borrelia miyamotoi]WAZ91749.1 DUF226 domain-containing protein [Borrelia miyamotoi]